MPKTTQPVASITAGQVVKALRDAGVPIKTMTEFNAQTDPNGQLDRPGSYTSKAACADRRIPKSKVRDQEPGAVEAGCGVEVFPNTAAATARANHIQRTLGEMQGMLGREYHYIRGGILLRVSGHLTPEQAEGYKTALQQLPG
ncbi:hypothetical protein ACSNOI_03365 [Actinomadura kijaniata]|uniref:hypothetical protein n=1 Tax=Actinomadura kijaniata TaxID=46161 RepID=UPI003F1D0B17